MPDIAQGAPNILLNQVEVGGRSAASLLDLNLRATGVLPVLPARASTQKVAGADTYIEVSLTDNN